MVKLLTLVATGAVLVQAAPSLHEKLDLLSRALKQARAPQYEEYVPFKIDEDYCVWQPKGDCWMNKAVDYLWKYMKYDQPDYSKYDWYKAKYADDEGVYGSGEDAVGEYQDSLIYLYELVNKHAGYKKYDYDYEDYIKEYEDQYCVWWYDGKCWTNDVITYVDKVWNETDPYKEKRQDKKDWAVYSTSKGVQSWYATVCYDLIVAIDKWGPVEYDWEDPEKKT